METDTLVQPLPGVRVDPLKEEPVEERDPLKEERKGDGKSQLREERKEKAAKDAGGGSGCFCIIGIVISIFVVVIVLIAFAVVIHVGKGGAEETLGPGDDSTPIGTCYIYDCSIGYPMAKFTRCINGKCYCKKAHDAVPPVPGSEYTTFRCRPKGDTTSRVGAEIGPCDNSQSCTPKYSTGTRMQCIQGKCFCKDGFTVKISEIPDSAPACVAVDLGLALNTLTASYGLDLSQFEKALGYPGSNIAGAFVRKEHIADLNEDDLNPPMPGVGNFHKISEISESVTRYIEAQAERTVSLEGLTVPAGSTPVPVTLGGMVRQGISANSNFQKDVLHAQSLWVVGAFEQSVNIDTLADKASQSVKDYIFSHTAAEIIGKYGEFVLKTVQLGGEWRKILRYENTQESTMASADLEKALSAGMPGADAMGSIGANTSQSVKVAIGKEDKTVSLNVENRRKGGTPSSTAAEWESSVKGNEAVIGAVFLPIWKFIERLDGGKGKDKAVEVQQHIQGTTNADTEKLDKYAPACERFETIGPNGEPKNKYYQRYIGAAKFHTYIHQAHLWLYQAIATDQGYVGYSVEFGEATYQAEIVKALQGKEHDVVGQARRRRRDVTPDSQDLYNKYGWFAEKYEKGSLQLSRSGSSLAKAFLEVCEQKHMNFLKGNFDNDQRDYGNYVSHTRRRLSHAGCKPDLELVLLDKYRNVITSQEIPPRSGHTATYDSYDNPIGQCKPREFSDTYAGGVVVFQRSCKTLAGHNCAGGCQTKDSPAGAETWRIMPNGRYQQLTWCYTAPLGHGKWDYCSSECVVAHDQWAAKPLEPDSPPVGRLVPKPDDASYFCINIPEGSVNAVRDSWKADVLGRNLGGQAVEFWNQWYPSNNRTDEEKPDTIVHTYLPCIPPASEPV